MTVRFHKRIRLERSLYGSPIPNSLTICTRNRYPAFTARALAEGCVGLLRRLADATETRVYAFCFMPDHVHLLLGAGKKDLPAFIGEWKGLTTRLGWQHGLKGQWWQRSFYDHFLRTDEDLEDCARYILNNPVRRGLVSTWKEYPFCGSWVFDTADW